MPQLPRTSDRALLKTLACLGPGNRDPMELLEKLSPSWNRRLQGADLARLPAHQAALELDQLRRDLLAERHPNPRRVHPTWWHRALLDESPAIRQAVGSALPDNLRRAIFPTLAHQAPSSRPPDPGALAWVLTLWAERLVGGPEPSDHDPPAILLLTTGGPYRLARELHLLGLTKCAYIKMCADDLEPATVLRLRPAARRSYLHLLARLQAEDLDRRFLRLAIHDLQTSRERGPRRLSGLTRLGLVSLSRLLAFAEPFRARWALQHLPYDLARMIRGLMNFRSPDLTPRLVFQWEESLWNLAAQGSPPRGEGRLP